MSQCDEASGRSQLLWRDFNLCNRETGLDENPATDSDEDAVAIEIGRFRVQVDDVE